MHVTSQCPTRSGFWYSWPCPSQLCAPPNFPSNRFPFSGGKGMKGLKLTAWVPPYAANVNEAWSCTCILLYLMGRSLHWLKGISASYCCFIAVSGWSSADKLYKIEHFVLSSVWNWTDSWHVIFSCCLNIVHLSLLLVTMLFLHSITPVIPFSGFLCCYSRFFCSTPQDCFFSLTRSVCVCHFLFLKEVSF